MAGVNLAALNGYYKTRYGEKQKLVPEWAVVQDMVEFEERATVGKDFREPLFLQRSQGVTFAAGANLGTIYTLNDSIPLQSQEAVLVPAEITMVESIAYGAIAQAQGAGPAAFGNAMDEVVLGLDESHRFFVEANCLYGQTSIATYTTVTADTATTLILTISAASWAPGIWAQAEKMLIDVYNGTTLINTVAAIQVTTLVSTTLRQIKITGNASDITAITGTSNYNLVLRGAGGTTSQVMPGIDKILTNTGSLFGIDAATYNLWRSNILTLNNVPLTMSGIHSAATAVVCRGGYGDMVFLVSPYAWQDLCDDQAALRRYGDDNRKEFVNGANELTFYGSNGGRMMLKPHPMVKAGEAFGLMTDNWVRGGATDLVNKLSGPNNDDFFLELPTQSGVQIRNFSSQFLYCRKPAKQVKITGIVSRSAP